MSEKDDDKLGIPMTEEEFIKVDKQPRKYELKVYQSMSKSFAQWFDDLVLHSGEKPKVTFINYGDTELVYVIGYGEKQFTMLIGQPKVQLGKVKQEAELLKKYALISRSSVVAPLAYYHGVQGVFDELVENERNQEYSHTFHKECFITPYYHQARCIASQPDGYGIYVPEPYYHFEKFSPEESEIVCACMVAKLVMLFDTKSKSGISACKLGGGDFILDKAWDREHLSTADTLKSMKLIAAREELHCSLEEYISRIREEFGKRTYYVHEKMRDPNVEINRKNRVGMSQTAIEKGIALGLRLRKTVSQQKTTSKIATDGKNGGKK